MEMRNDREVTPLSGGGGRQILTKETVKSSAGRVTIDLYINYGREDGL